MEFTYVHRSMVFQIKFKSGIESNVVDLIWFLPACNQHSHCSDFNFVTSVSDPDLLHLVRYGAGSGSTSITFLVAGSGSTLKSVDLDPFGSVYTSKMKIYF